MTGTTILIVDDDRTIVRLCQRLLERASYQVITAIDPLDALQVLDRQKVDLLLSDIHMPFMDGFKLITEAKQRQPDLSVLVMAGYRSIDDAIQALHRGVDGLVIKPFENTTELVQTVQRILNETSQKRDSARLRVLRPLFDVTERLLSVTSPQALEKLILNTVSELFQATFAGIYRDNQEGGGLEPVKTLEKTVSGDGSFWRLRLLDGLMDDHAPVRICASSPGFSDELIAQLGENGWGSLLVAPVQRDNSHFVYCAARDQASSAFTEADMEMFVILARQAAVAMENARLYSELKNYVRRVEDSQRALIQAEKMAAVGRLMATLSHEINNPLQAVRNCLHLAAREDLENDQRAHYLEMTDKELDRLVKTARRMLDFYRPGGIQRDHVTITEIIDQVLALLNPQLKEQNIRVHDHVSPGLPRINVVSDQIQQVVFNLLLNAMDALEEDDRAVSLAAAVSKEIWIDAFCQDNYLHVLIEDSGPGLQSGYRGRVFEPFISTKPKGTGLGLAVSYEIMERHQGCLSIISPRYRNGACFKMTLPVNVEGHDGKNINC